MRPGSTAAVASAECSLFLRARTEIEIDIMGGVPIRAFESEVLAALLGALSDIGLDVSEDKREQRIDHGGRTWQPDAVFTVNGQQIVIEVKAAVTDREASQLVSYARALPFPMLVASRRIADGARKRLKQEGVGYYDGRGRLRLALPGILVDTDAPPIESVDKPPAAFEGEVVREVAIVLLDAPNSHHGPRSVARTIGRAPSAVSAALDRLRANDLLTSANEPVIPELFWELAGVWRRAAQPLAGLPEPGRGSQNALLQLGLDEEVGLGTDRHACGEGMGDAHGRQSRLPSGLLRADDHCLPACGCAVRPRQRGRRSGMHGRHRTRTVCLPREGRSSRRALEGGEPYRRRARHCPRRGAGSGDPREVEPAGGDYPCLVARSRTTLFFSKTTTVGESSHISIRFAAFRSTPLDPRRRPGRQRACRAITPRDK